MTFNELKKHCEDHAGEIDSVYVTTIPVKVIGGGPAIGEVEYTDGSKDEFTSDIPDVLPKESGLQIGADDFFGGNQLRVFDGLNILTIEVEDPDAEFAYDLLDSLLDS